MDDDDEDNLHVSLEEDPSNAVRLEKTCGFDIEARDRSDYVGGRSLQDVLLASACHSQGNQGVRHKHLQTNEPRRGK